MPLRCRGAALLLVLWLIALLTALIAAFALNARIEQLQGSVIQSNAVAGELARAGIEYGLVRVADNNPRSHWNADGTGYPWRFADARLRVRIIDESGKVDINQADAGLLSQLIKAVGVEEPQALRISAAIIDWRDADDLSQPQGSAEDPDYAAAGLPYGAKDAPFETLPELQQVLGMTPELFQKLLPYLTIYTGRSTPDANFAAGPVLTAMGLDARNVLQQRQLAAGSQSPDLVAIGSGTYSIDSRATLANGRHADVRAVVRAGQGTVPGSTYTVLRWEEGAVRQ
ncbi:general secretion pathway protein GspK [Pseudoxanthomonas dokdonensis]|uniref:Type II secretion system protein K n=1 Tax=Pseudoxanthomonas dokdonensis TaxID=344882 RepID=A0A0R0CX58_9GAMM|nr:type II secretion system protein GspK [Pseudoxanthomonas dokdonensis]KRG69656.1 general secretion pathway protein GspK [Pseudoxanthomonas dokdonensis]